MTADVGRDVVFAWGDTSPQTVIPGVRETGIVCNGEAIDVTSRENSGKRQLLTVSAMDTVNVSLSGVTKDRTLRKDWHDGNRTRAATLTYPNGDTLTGNFYLQSHENTGPHDDAEGFTAELLSTGAITFAEGS